MTCSAPSQYLDQWRPIVNWTSETDFCEIGKKINNFVSIKCIQLKMLSVKRWPFCSELDMLEYSKKRKFICGCQRKSIQLTVVYIKSSFIHKMSFVRLLSHVLLCYQQIAHKQVDLYKDMFVTCMYEYTPLDIHIVWFGLFRWHCGNDIIAPVPLCTW